jgi:hypothetical protein
MDVEGEQNAGGGEQAHRRQKREGSAPKWSAGIPNQI